MEWYSFQIIEVATHSNGVNCITFCSSRLWRMTIELAPSSSFNIEVRVAHFTFEINGFGEKAKQTNKFREIRHILNPMREIYVYYLRYSLNDNTMWNHSWTLNSVFNTEIQPQNVCEAKIGILKFVNISESVIFKMIFGTGIELNLINCRNCRCSTRKICQLVERIAW